MSVDNNETDRDGPAAAAVATAAERPRSVFGRLRDVSRSNTRSRSRSNSIVFGTGYNAATKSPAPSRPASRAASIILGRGANETEQVPPIPLPAPAPENPTTTPAPGPSSGLGLTSPTAPSASPLVMPGPEDRRREAWEDDDAEVGYGSGWRDEHGRLGVLPSPSVQESVGPASPGKARKGSWIGEVVEAPVVVEEDVEGWRLPEPAEQVERGVVKPSTADSKQQDESVVPKDSTAVPAANVDETPSASEPDARRSSLDNSKVRRPSVKHAQSRSASSAFPASTAPRPQPERKFSALDQLPSQQRRRQFTPVATPRRMSLADGAAPARAPEPLPNFAPMQNQTSRTQGNSDFLADVRPSPTKASRPSTPANWDKLSAVSSPKAVDDAASRRSSVSSLGNPQSPDTVIIPGAASKRQSVIGMPTSTLDNTVDDGQPRSVSPLHFEGNATGPRTLTMEPESMVGGGRSQDSDFMNRDYRPDQGAEQRPMSYMPHSRRSSGVMAQDTIDVTQSGKRYSTASGMADYPVPGAFPYPQQPSQPASRAPSIKQPPSEYDKLRSPQAGDADPVVGESSSKHSSGFFRDPDVSAAGGPGAIPSPSKLDANYDGLIDPQVDQIADDIAKAEQPQKRRKSGIMDSFRRASTYSSANASRPSSREGAAKGTASANESALAKSKTLKKPQRTASSAVEPPKNKRFSGLGSLFRRSSTMTPRTGAPVGAQAANSQTASPVTPKASKKLTKTQPPQQQQQQQHYTQPPANYYVGPPPGNYAGHPGQGQQMLPHYWQQQQPQPQQMYAEPVMASSPYQPQIAAIAGPQRQSGYYQQGPPQAQYQQYPPQAANQQYQNSVPNSRTHSLVGSPVSEQAAPFEYYGSPQGQSAQPMPQPRRLHSEGHWRRDTVPGIPEANSPVDSSKGTSVAPARSYTDGHVESASAQGSPQQQAQPVPSRPTVDTRQSSTYSQSSVVRSPAMAQIPDNFPQAPGRQDYQTQYWQHQHRPQREPLLPHLQTQAPPASVPTTGVGSIDQQMARSPAKDYHDQQTPWSVSLPQDGSNRQPSGPSWTQQPQSTPPQQQQYTGPPAAARGAIRTQSHPQGYQDQYSSMTPYYFVPPQQSQNTAPPQVQQRPPHYGDQVSSPTTYTTTSPHQPSSPAPYSRVSPQGYEYSSPEQYHHGYAQEQQQQRQQQQQPRQQNRYYSQVAPRSAGPGPGPQRQYSQNDQGRPLTYQRTASGYSGRRDDAGVSESEIMNMRGASYPGQEWMPGRG